MELAREPTLPLSGVFVVLALSAPPSDLGP
ncbi:uncharacterized protein SOCE836_101530 [Sorangium cellulosum]|uniref:Uncharacterized protein n=1 Tax=Sorangium cellulosum TaxID=56 RepID=A0A4P2R4G4_SORCE|nr:uncharacterized protein SOCE836_101530 [Sorangium cellulosum]WCQ97202.1 hypothetical protein NQZ70_09993 [Sorangium sp. Soce836]